MLQEFREQHLTWDKANRRIHESVKANASDTKGRKLTVQVLNDGVVEDLTGTSLSLYWETRNKKNKGLDAFDVVDASQGIFELYYTTGMLSNEGKLRANLVLVDNLGKIVSDAFVIEVSPGIDDDAVESSDSFTALTKALVDVQNLEQNYAPRLNEVTAQLAQKVDEVVFDVSSRTMKFYANESLVNSIDMTEASTASLVQDYIDSLVADSQIEGVTIADRSVTPEKTTFLVPSKNLFNQEYEKGWLLNTGALYPHETDYVFVRTIQPNTTYTVTRVNAGFWRAGLNSEDTLEYKNSRIIFENREATTFTFTSRADEDVLVMYFGSNQPKFLQLEKGGTSTELVTHGYNIKNLSAPFYNANKTGDPSYYGIRGDGHADDTHGFKSYAYDLKEKGGGEFSLPYGRYKLSGTVEFPSNVIVDLSNALVFLADNFDLARKPFRENRDMFPIFTNEVDATNLLFKNFTLEGNQSDFRNHTQVGIGFFDTQDVVSKNVKVFNINYNPELFIGSNYGSMGYNIVVARSRFAKILGGRYEYGGYENVGVERSEDVIVDGIFSGRAARTSLQVHRGSKRIKILNSMINQITDLEDAGAFTVHSMEGSGEGIEDLTIAHNTIVGQFSRPQAHDYNALLQLMDDGISRKFKILHNTISGNRPGIRSMGLDDTQFIGNNVDVERGTAIQIGGVSNKVFLDGNFAKSQSGSTFVDHSSQAILGKNVGF